MEEKIEIEYAKLKDVNKIYKIMKDYGIESYTADSVRDLIKSKLSVSLELILDNTLVGALGARVEGKNSLWLYYLVVNKNYRSRGYATRLMNRFFEESRKRGIKRIAIDTDKKEFFERFGFKEVGRLPNWNEYNDQALMFRVLE